MPAAVFAAQVNVYADHLTCLLYTSGNGNAKGADRHPEQEVDLAVHTPCGNGNGAKPVSYTHLDVYKRQVPVLWRADTLPEREL